MILWILFFHRKKSMRKIYYSTRNISDYSLNASHSGVCDKQERKTCDKYGYCYKRLCGLDKRDTFGEIDWQKASLNAIDKYHKNENKIRKRWFKECKPIEFIIQRPKKEK